MTTKFGQKLIKTQTSIVFPANVIANLIEFPYDIHKIEQDSHGHTTYINIKRFNEENGIEKIVFYQKYFPNSDLGRKLKIEGTIEGVSISRRINKKTGISIDGIELYIEKKEI